MIEDGANLGVPGNAEGLQRVASLNSDGSKPTRNGIGGHEMRGGRNAAISIFLSNQRPNQALRDFLAKRAIHHTEASGAAGPAGLHVELFLVRNCWSCRAHKRISSKVDGVVMDQSEPSANPE